MVDGRIVATCGELQAQLTGNQRAQFTLTLADTSGQVRGFHAYPRLPLALDYATDLVRTPRGGYLLSGDGYATTGFQHLLLETDSLGRQLKQRLLFPLGPIFNGGSRLNGYCTIVTLPHAQGYIASGRADSIVGGVAQRQVGYLLRLDTALNVMWVYRHPTSTNGNGTRSQYAYKVRLLPDGSAAFMVSDVRGAGTPDVYWVRVDAQTGRHLGTYTLSSNTQAAVEPLDWQWLGDGTLLMCGQSQAAGVSGQQAYLARWDFRGTPLAQALGVRPGAADAAQLLAWPNPARGQVRLRWPVAWAGTEVALYDVLGRVVVRQEVAAGQAQAGLSLAGVGPGVYALRLRTAQGTVSKRLVVE